ncbi:hypothetical protein BS17DRAFT_879002 [Gyrodon lividus]|nr:hypothetical protein BS17DRAFT_879002 [Gyrodon lividus]
MCFLHILNICSGHIADQYMDIDFAMIGNAWVDALDPNIVVDKDAYLEALREDPIALGHDVICIVHASNLRREAFNNTIITGNQMNWFTDEEGEPTNLPILKLIRDMKSHWDSIYLMINHLHILKQALDYFFRTRAHRDIANHGLDEMHWCVLEDLETVLEIPHATQQTMSGESLPLLSYAILLFEAIIVQWDHLRRSAPHCAPFIDVGLTTARNYYHRMGRINAYAITMLVDPAVRLSWIEAHWTQDDVTKVRQVVLKLMSDHRKAGNWEASEPLVACNPLPGTCRPNAPVRNKQLNKNSCCM